MPAWIIPALITLGLVLLYLEFFLPGGILAVASGILLLAATLLVFIHYGPAWGSLTALFLLIASALLLRLWMARFHRSFLGKRLTLGREVGKDEYLAFLPSLVGKTGRVVVDLRPSGKAIIEGEKYDVVSAVGILPCGTGIRVLSIDGLRIMVMPVNT